MPLTLPSHAAAILPFTRVRWLPPSALVVGAAAPDVLGYLLRLPGSHVWDGLLLRVLPAGFLLWLWTEWLLLPLLRDLLPSRWGGRPERLLATRGVCLRPGALLGALVAVGLGAATHLLWDGFTHDGLWPASQLYPEVRTGLPFGLTVARALQHVSTLVGAALALWAWARANLALEPGAPARLEGPGPRALGGVLLAVLGAAALQCVRELRWRGPQTPPALLAWTGFWAAGRGALVMLTLAGLWALWRRRGLRRAEAPAVLDPPPPAA